MAKYTKQIANWAKIFSDTFVNESKDSEIEENDMLKGCKHNGHVDEDENDDTSVDEADILEATPQFTIDKDYIRTVARELAPYKQRFTSYYYRVLDRLADWKIGDSTDVDAKTFAQQHIQNMLGKTDSDIPTKEQAHKDTLSAREKLMAQVAARNKAAAEPEVKPPPSYIKSIWVKNMVVDDRNDMNSYADIEYEYHDGTKKNEKMSISTTKFGSKQGYVSRFIQMDQQYVSLKRHMPKATDLDIRLSMIRIQYTDPKIQWYYGPNKVADKNWSFSAEAKKEAEKAKAAAAAATPRKKWYEESENDQIEESLINFSKKILSM